MAAQIYVTISYHTGQHGFQAHQIGDVRASHRPILDKVLHGGFAGPIATKADFPFAATDPVPYQILAVRP